MDFATHTNSSMVTASDRFAYESHQPTARPGAFSALGLSARTATNENTLPPRRDGTPPRLLGDHPAQIAQTLVPITSRRPNHDPLLRKRKIRNDRRWDDAKMVALSFIVLGLIGGTIQWTRMGEGVTDSKVIESSELKVKDSQIKQVDQQEPRVDQQEPQVASNNDAGIGVWHKP